MPLHLEYSNPTYESESLEANQNSRSQIRKEIGKQIYELLQTAKDLPTEACLTEIRNTLLEIQKSCQAVEKSFLFIEKRITCANYQLGGLPEDTATLFRGPREDASVAICVTDKGSLLHRNGSPWMIYHNAGDVLRETVN